MPTILDYRDVSGFPGYVVGSDGSVWSWHNVGAAAGTWRDTPRQLKPYRLYTSRYRKTPYHQVSLRKNGQYWKPYVHQLVLEAFVGPCPPGFECCHRDDNGENNWLDNLSWGTPRQNSAQAKLNGTDNMGSHHGMAKLTENDIPKIRSLLAQGMTQDAVAQLFGVNQGTISLIHLKVTWTHVP